MTDNKLVTNSFFGNDLYDFDQFIRERPVGDDLILMGMAEDGVEVGVSTWKQSMSPNMVIENGLLILKTMVYHVMDRPGFRYFVITSRPKEWRKCSNVVVSYMTGAENLILHFSNYVVSDRRNRNEVILLILDNLDGVLDHLDFETKQILLAMIENGRKFGVFVVAEGHSNWDNRFELLVRFVHTCWQVEGSEIVRFRPLGCDL